MKINYGMMWCGNKGEKRKSQNFSIEYDLDWNDQDEHVKFKDYLHAIHPGYTLMGYAPAQEEVIEE